MIARLVLGLVAVFAFALFMLSQPAAAAYPCPGGPGPGEVQVGVTGGSHGVAAIPVCDRAQGGGDSDGGGVYYIYGSIAWHPDADDVWMIGSYDAPYIAEREALAACNGAMGGGCSSIGEWHNSSMAIIRDRSGVLWNAWTGNGGAARKRTLAECSAKQHVPCEVLATFSSGKRRHAPDLATARKLYAVGAWVEGTEGFDSRLYIASGQRDPRVAERLALEACAKATARRCGVKFSPSPATALSRPIASAPVTRARRSKPAPSAPPRRQR